MMMAIRMSLHIVDRFLLESTALCLLCCMAIAIREYRQEIGAFAQPVPPVLYRVTQGIPGCASGKWLCTAKVQDGQTTIEMEHAGRRR